MEKLIVKATYVLRTKEEMVVQPFSSKISRTAVLSFSNTYKSAISSTEPLKPFRVTALHVGKNPCTPVDSLLYTKTRSTGSV